ncbi:MAG: DUF3107 domain-containing protein [Actinomycetota bacterium]
MDVRIGIAQSGQILEIELAEDADRDEVKARLDAVLAGTEQVLWLTDRKGKDTGVSAERVSFIELSSADTDRRIGFG